MTSSLTPSQLQFAILCQVFEYHNMKQERIFNVI